MEKTIETIQQEQPAPTCKSCGFYENNCPFIRDTFKPYPNKVCKDYIYSVMKAQEQPETDLLEEVYMRGFAQGAKEERKDLTPLINRLCEAILFEWKDAADLARKTLTQIKAREE